MPARPPFPEFLMSIPPQSDLLRLVTGLVLCAALAGCVSTSPYDAMARATPSGSPFARALFADYSALARSFGLANAPSGTSFGASASLSLSGLDSDVAAVANAFADKAISASKGEEPLPEPAPPDDEKTDALRMRLLRVLDTGRTKAPAAAALAQANYDCWIMDNQVDSLAASSSRCRRAFVGELLSLEQRLNVTPPSGR